MKVRRIKESERMADSWNVLEESPNFYITVEGQALSKSLYEKVPPEPRWQDVTGECNDNGFNYIFHPGCNSESGGIHGYEARKHYRLRKVQVIRGDWRVSEPVYTDAFVVERKVG